MNPRPKTAMPSWRLQLLVPFISCTSFYTPCYDLGSSFKDESAAFIVSNIIATIEAAIMSALTFCALSKHQLSHSIWLTTKRSLSSVVAANCWQRLQSVKLWSSNHTTTSTGSFVKASTCGIGYVPQWTRHLMMMTMMIIVLMIIYQIEFGQFEHIGSLRSLYIL